MRSALFVIALGLGTAAIAQDMPQPSPAGAGQTVPAANTAPERDARGIPVVSDPAQAPAGFNEGPRPAGTGLPADSRPAPMAESGPTPPCSRTVTDNCVQTYERGVRATRPR